VNGVQKVVKLLLVEDSTILQRSITAGLCRSGYVVDQAFDGQQAEQYIASVTYDAIILDLMIPKVDGLTLLAQLRRSGNTTRVLILSARDTLDDRIKGLDIGADDYLVKPFSFEELLSRLRAIMRRELTSAYADKGALNIGELKIDTHTRTVSYKTDAIDLTLSEYVILELLVRQRGVVFTHEQLIDKVMSTEKAVTRNAVEARISSLRRKLRSANAPTLIETRRGFGYFIAR